MQPGEFRRPGTFSEAFKEYGGQNDNDYRNQAENLVRNSLVGKKWQVPEKHLIDPRLLRPVRAHPDHYSSAYWQCQRHPQKWALERLRQTHSTVLYDKGQKNRGRQSLSDYGSDIHEAHRMKKCWQTP